MKTLFFYFSVLVCENRGGFIWLYIGYSDLIWIIRNLGKYWGNMLFKKK
jgi:hypothetical protein